METHSTQGRWDFLAPLTEINLGIRFQSVILSRDPNICAPSGDGLNSKWVSYTSEVRSSCAESPIPLKPGASDSWLSRLGITRFLGSGSKQLKQVDRLAGRDGFFGSFARNE
jgi:hypothetical protein